MKDLVKGFIKWCLIVLLTLNIILWAFIAIHCQAVAQQLDTHPRHASQEDVEDTMGFISVQFLSKDDRLIYWKRETKYEIRLSSFGYDQYTRFETKPEKLHGKICVIFCRTHLFAYLVTQCKE